MALTDTQRSQISDNISRLDDLNGTGVLSSSKKSMVKELFLFISAGGVGAKALREIKNTVMQQVDINEVDRQIMFICADTCYSDLDSFVEQGAFKEDEILKIPYENALNVINPQRISPTTEEWVHPELYARTNAKAGYFDGTGASALRQCGRVMFAQSETQNRLYQKLTGIKNKAAAMSAEGIAGIKLQVIFLAGIAGGTGSGTIIDLGFLTRFYLNQILNGMQNRITYSAYIFLPSACGTPGTTTDQANGNKNAYAALKEIDYFMNLKSLNESFRMDYGTPETHNMVIRDNLFDFCTLVEGVGGGGVFFGDPADTARKITALSIMNILCANNAGTSQNGQNVFLADAFLSNQDQQARTRILLHSDRVWPREANYHYNIIGYAACIVPVNLLTVYAFKKVFDRIYVEFRKHNQATPQMAESFLQNCGLDFRSVDRNYRNLTPQSVSDNLENVSAKFFEQYGPYFMINLTNQAAELIRNPAQGYIAQAQTKLNGFIVDKNKWNYIINLYSFLLQQLVERNNSLYDVYTFVLEEMGRLLEDNAGILTKTTELRNKYGSSFYWTPIDLTNGNNATTAVAEYLDGIMNSQRINQLAYLFVQQMYKEKDRWTSLAPRDGQGTISFDVAQEIRRFIKNQMSDLVGKTLEDFIVMAYSANPNATPSVMQNGKEIPSAATRTAAQQILSRLNTNAVPLASVRGDFSVMACYHNVYLTIPETCKWLYSAILELAGSYGLQPSNIFKSSSNDSIVWSNLISGVPAWAFSWTSAAEEIYEGGTGPDSVGLHIEQGTRGRNWSQLPNLYPEGLWTHDERKTRTREAALSAAVRQDMAQAREKGLLVPETDPNQEKDLYKLTRFKKGETAESLWNSLQLVENQKYEASQIYQLLRDAGLAEDRRVECIGFVTSDIDVKDKDALAYEMSCRIVRKNSRERKDLTRTLVIAGELEDRLREWNDGCVDLSILIGFIDALKWDVITYEPYMGLWVAALDTEEALGNRLSSKFEKMCAHYFGFRQYQKAEKNILKQIQNAVTAKQENAEKDDFKALYEKAAALKDSVKAFRTAKTVTETPWKQNSPFAFDGNKAPWPMGRIDFPAQAEQLGENGKDIRTFYENLENLL